MRLLHLHHFRSSLYKLSFFSAANSLMGSKLFCKTIPFFDSYSFYSHCCFTNNPSFTAFSSKCFSRVQPFCMKTNGYSSYASHARIPRPPAYIETQKESMLESTSSTILKRKLLEIGVDFEHCVTGQQVNLLCPMCKGGESEEKSLSLHIAEDWSSAVWLCFRGKCGWKGCTRAFADSGSSHSMMEHAIKVKNTRQITVEGLHLRPLCNELVDYFAQRLISRKTLERNSVKEKRYDGQFAIAFTYWRRGSLVSCKYRDAKKNFWQEADTEKILYGLDDIEGASDVIIVEGEMDKLAMEEAGLFNCVSVPDGAPASVSTKELPPKERDTKYQYLWNCKDYLKEASRIILATDGDLPGQALAEEIARRLGRERCWRVRWPKKNENEHYKDANEVLMYLGPSALKEVIDNAELYPIRGLFNFRDYFDEIDAYYHQSLGYEYGVSTGWTALNDLYNVMLGELTIVTGVPNSGKSEWIDALLCNLNASVGWKFALCSMENKSEESQSAEEDLAKREVRRLKARLVSKRARQRVPQLPQKELRPRESRIRQRSPARGLKVWLERSFRSRERFFVGGGFQPSLDIWMWLEVREHARKLLEKKLKKPFFNARYGRSTERMSVDEFEEGKRWLTETFYLIRCENDSLPNIEWVLDLAKSAVLRHGVHGLVIDPYNELDHQRPPNQTETEYVSQMLTKVKRFAQHHSCHVWFVAHPRQLHQWVGKPPNLYDISGSAHFINKCDNGIVIHRNRDPEVGPVDQVQVCVRKVRNKVVGTVGEAFLSYNRVTGEFMDVDSSSGKK